MWKEVGGLWEEEWLLWKEQWASTGWTCLVHWPALSINLSTMAPHIQVAWQPVRNDWKLISRS